MIRCPQCGTLNRNTAHFCSHCGALLSAGRLCPSCGATNRPTAKVCSRCGAPLGARKCPACGGDNRPTARWCRHCGASLPAAIICLTCGQPNRAAARFCKVCGAGLGVPVETPVSSVSSGRQGVPLSVTGRLPPNTVLHERYIVLQRIAQGGMGAVYRVSDQRLANKVWALKEMGLSHIPTSERAEAIAAFQREAELLATLNHPNLPRVADVFEEGGRQYMVMEFIDGQTLLEILESTSGFLAEDRVLAWAEQLCDALEYLHSQDPPIIYRDLKPGNVMEVRGSTTVKLIDFGIARFYKSGKKHDTMFIGTDGYAPPEQYGKAQTDVRSDVYALGATLHHLLTKRDPQTTPFKFPAVRSINKKVSREVSAAIATAVRVKPQDRFQSVTEFKVALLGGRSEAEVAAVSSKPKRKPVASPKKRRKRAVAGAISLSPRILDFGKVEQGSYPTQSFTVSAAGAPAVQMSADQPWLSVSPTHFTQDEQEITVTLDTTRMPMARWRGKTPNVVRNCLDIARGLPSDLWGVVILALLVGLVFLSVILGIVLGTITLGLLLPVGVWLGVLQARQWVPAPRTHYGQVEIEIPGQGVDSVEVEVTVIPTGAQKTLAWAGVVGAVLVEVGIIVAILWGIVAG